MQAKASFRAVAAILIAACSLLVAGQAMAQDKISAKLAKPMKAAQDALQNKEWDKALAKLTEADGNSSKTEFDQFQINEFKAYIYLQQRKYGDVARLYETNLNSPKMPAEQVNERLKVLTQLNTAIKNYPKVISHGERWIKADGRDANIRVLVGQAHYVQKDYKRAIEVMQGVVRNAERNGRAPDENWLQIIRSAQVNLGDNAAASRTLEKLVRFNPKPEYWHDLLATRLSQRASDRIMLNTYRLAEQAGTLSNPHQYLEMAELLLEAGLPGEAVSVLETGQNTAKVLDTADKPTKDRYQRRMEDARAAAAKDLASLPQIEKEAERITTGQGDVALGMVYSSFGKYEQAAAALSKGLNKGQIRDPDQTQLMLGIANLKLGKKDDALQAFEGVKEDPEMVDLARLWTLMAKSGGGAA